MSKHFSSTYVEKIGESQYGAKDQSCHRLFLCRSDVQMKSTMRSVKFKLVSNRRHLLALKLSLLLLLELAKLWIFLSFQMENALVASHYLPDPSAARLRGDPSHPAQPHATKKPWRQMSQIQPPHPISFFIYFVVVQKLELKRHFKILKSCRKPTDLSPH